MALFEQTLGTDPALQREYDVLRALKSCVRRAAPDAEPPATLTVRLQAGLDAIDASRPSVSWHRWRRPAAVLAAAAALALVVMPLTERPGTAPQPAIAPRVALDLNAGTLAQAHRDWQAQYASQSPADQTPRQMAAALAEQLGYAVVPPDPDHLQARLLGCSTCGHSVPGARAAVFVMAREGAAPLTLFEVGGESCQVATPGFSACAEQGVQIATVDGISLACWKTGGVHAVLAAEQPDAEALAKLAPQAVMVAHGGPAPRTVRLALGF
jgi:hypothetical protein